MKKSLLLLGAVVLGAVAGCGSKTSSSVDTGVNYSIGLGYSTSFKSTQAAVTTLVAAFDADGKVLSARADEMQIPLTVVASEGEEGTVYTPGINPEKNAGLLSKQELGTDYNMLGASPIGKEVYEQIETMTQFFVGKTVAEVKALVGENGKFTAEAAESSSCTITVSGYVAALENAYATKQAALKGTASKTGVGIYVEMYGKNELTAYIAGAVTDESGKVEAMDVDNVVFPLVATLGADETTYECGIDTTSKYYSATGMKSKKTLGDAYAMYSIMNNPCGEWYTQAAAIEKGLVGKTGSEIAGVKEIAGASIKIDAIIKSAAEAATYAPKAVITSKPVA